MPKLSILNYKNSPLDQPHINILKIIPTFPIKTKISSFKFPVHQRRTKFSTQTKFNFLFTDFSIDFPRSTQSCYTSRYSSLMRLTSKHVVTEIWNCVLSSTAIKIKDIRTRERRFIAYDWWSFVLPVKLWIDETLAQNENNISAAFYRIVASCRRKESG